MDDVDLGALVKARQEHDTLGALGLLQAPGDVAPNQRVWVVMKSDHGSNQLAGIGATKAAALRLVAEEHDGKHEPDLEWFEDGSGCAASRRAASRSTRPRWRTNLFSTTPRRGPLPHVMLVCLEAWRAEGRAQVRHPVGTNKTSLGGGALSG